MCGMTRKEDILHAIRIGVDAIGLIFYNKSPRCVSIEKAKKLLEGLPLFVDVVAVVVNPDIDDLFELLEQLPITVIQFHGEESQSFCKQFKKPFIKSIMGVTENEVLRQIKNYPDARAFLLDAGNETHRGGTGTQFDWNIIPKNISKPIILAGGLNTNNVKTVKLLPNDIYAVDVCSGIEKDKGIKDHQKMTAFIESLA